MRKLEYRIQKVELKKKVMTIITPFLFETVYKSWEEAKDAILTIPSDPKFFYQVTVAPEIQF